MKQINAIHKLSGRLLFQQILPRIARILLFSECKKISILLILFAVILQYSQAQNFQFEQILPLPPEPQNLVPFDGVGGIGENRIAYADIDGDNDQDVLITGMCYSEIIAKLYTNIKN